MASGRFYTERFEEIHASPDSLDLVERARRLMDAASGDSDDPLVPPADHFEDTANSSRADWRVLSDQTLLHDDTNEQWHNQQMFDHERFVVNLIGGALMMSHSHRHLSVQGAQGGPLAPLAHSQSTLLLENGRSTLYYKANGRQVVTRGLHWADSYSQFGAGGVPPLDFDPVTQFRARLDHAMASLGIRESAVRQDELLRAS